MSHFQKILVPMDGSPSSIAALEEALVLATDLDSAIDVLEVRAPERLELGSPDEERAMEHAIGEARALIGDRLERRTETGEPVRVIIEVAATTRADLIVIGTHGRVGRLRSLVGSVAEGVVRSAPCPVLTVRGEDGERESFRERIHGRKALGDSSRPAPRR
jgi:nucleotide-binding universal stress UspA family protein